MLKLWSIRRTYGLGHKDLFDYDRVIAKGLRQRSSSCICHCCGLRIAMREFMDYVHSAFYSATGWDKDNSYVALNSTSDGKTSILEYIRLCAT